jgi:hypothetical protein
MEKYCESCIFWGAIATLEPEVVGLEKLSGAPEGYALRPGAVLFSGPGTMANKQELLHFLDQHVFNPILKASPREKAMRTNGS